ncbi:MAG: hypothetical protein J5529_07705 [Prevotella sp.]|nr:hypothetical protein [Prevotella sp.]
MDVDLFVFMGATRETPRGFTLQSYEKSRAGQKELVLFSCRDGVTYLKLRINERKGKGKLAFLLPILSINMPFQVIGAAVGVDFMSIRPTLRIDKK